MPEQLERLDHRLDRLEERLPTLPAASLRLQRSLANRSCAMVNGLARAWWGAIGDTADRAGAAAATVTGTGRYAGRQASTAVATAAKQVAGQTEAQVRGVVRHADQELTDAASETLQVADRAMEDVARAVDAVTEAADPDRTPTGETYQDLTKAQLYRRATNADIDGRSTMSKAELITALVEHDAAGRT